MNEKKLKKDTPSPDQQNAIYLTDTSLLVSAAAGSGKSILSPLPGVIISVDVKQGDSVKRGDKVAVIEAMKMENEILSDCDGTVTAVHVQKGDTVADEAKIVTIG